MHLSFRVAMPNVRRYWSRSFWSHSLFAGLLLGAVLAGSGCSLLGGGEDDDGKKYPEPPGRPNAVAVSR